MKKILLFAAVAAIGFSSCSQDEAIENHNEANAISFDTYVGKAPQGRAAAASDESIKDGFGVFAYLTSSTWANVETAANFMSNEKVSFTDPNWEYTNTKYWPTNGDKISFFAYAPYSELTNSNITAADNGILTFKLNSTLANQSDLIYDNAQIDKTKADGKVKFTFGHALARIGVKFTSTAIANSSVTVNSITFGSSSTATFYASNTFNIRTAEWGTGTPTTTTHHTFTLSSSDLSNSGTFTVGSSTANNADKYLMIIPQDFSTSMLPVSVTYTLTAPGSAPVEITATDNINVNFAKGTSYLLNIVLTPTAIEFDEPIVSEWPDDDSHSFTPTVQ